MSGDYPYLSYLVIYIISGWLWSSDTLGATHWVLNEREGVVRASSATADILKSDPVLSILTKSHPPKTGNGRKTNCDQCSRVRSHGMSNVINTVGPTSLELFPAPQLTCGHPVNETFYDHLEGIANREYHPKFVEEDVALLFKKGELEEIDLGLIESNLKRAIEESPNSPVVCNHIGNFWRIRGSTYHSIECFRRALFFSPNDADALLNLAKVLYNLNYVQDAAYLARRSLEMQPTEQNCWLQHFTLGEILRASGELEEAGVHFKHALDLNPSFELAEVHLREIGSPSTSSTNTYTFLIIGLLVVVVLATVYFMTLTSENRSTKSSRMSLWVEGKRPRKRPMS
ncbi:tetratricopeptide repeat protein 17-like [Montipora capricornis]|uniref:tetratricopeptide repeat protein 17-like n=1 Tax=Montipora capricornis TaxID=246305 RepID=UPI0035F21A74